MIHRVIEKLTEIASAVRNGEEVDAGRIEALLAEGRASIGDSHEEDVVRLLKVVEALEVLVRDRFEDVGEELRRLGNGRQALKGYNHIRGLSEGQRLYRRA